MGNAPPLFVGTFLWAWLVPIHPGGGHGVLNLISARMIDKRKGHTFTQVVAALNCRNIPFGIALGIFTFVVLGDKEVRMEYGMVA